MRAHVRQQIVDFDAMQTIFARAIDRGEIAAARGAHPSISPREGAMSRPESTGGAGWRNEPIAAIAKAGRSK